MRIREYSESIPKPMVPIGYRPILWHLMKYYAHYGHREFILCLGWRADVIKQYFLNYNECQSNDFVLSLGGSKVDLLSRDIHDWKITFVDTGNNANIGERLAAVRPHLEGDETFLANYSDGLSNVDLSQLIAFHKLRQSVATFMAVRPTHTFHKVNLTPEGQVTEISGLAAGNLWMNAGYFVFQREIFDMIRPGEELVEQPFQRLIARNQLSAFRHDDFYACMDTFKEKQSLDDLHAAGRTPWEVWKPLAAPILESDLMHSSLAHRMV